MFHLDRETAQLLVYHLDSSIQVDNHLLVPVLLLDSTYPQGKYRTERHHTSQSCWSMFREGKGIWLERQILL